MVLVDDARELGVSDRHYDTYDYRGFVGNFQWADPGCQTADRLQHAIQRRHAAILSRQSPATGRQILGGDRSCLRGLTVTPTFGYQDDNYSISATEAGLVRSQSVKAGVEVAYAINPSTTIIVAYMNEQYRQKT